MATKSYLPSAMCWSAASGLIRPTAMIGTSTSALTAAALGTSSSGTWGP